MAALSPSGRTWQDPGFILLRRQGRAELLFLLQLAWACPERAPSPCPVAADPGGRVLGCPEPEFCGESPGAGSLLRAHAVPLRGVQAGLAPNRTRLSSAACPALRAMRPGQPVDGSSGVLWQPRCGLLQALVGRKRSPGRLLGQPVPPP